VLFKNLIDHKLILVDVCRVVDHILHECPILGNIARPLSAAHTLQLGTCCKIQVTAR